MRDAGKLPVALAGLSHHDADVASLEAFRFHDEEAFLHRAREHFKGVVVVQTCNRVEVMVQGDGQSLSTFLEEDGRSGFNLLEGAAVLRHLLELGSGLDSMIVGEDQIIGQLKSSLTLSQELGTCSKLLELCIAKAVHVGIRARQLTGINKGAVSIGSAAVELAESMLGSLEQRHILVIGSGEIGQLVALALAVKNLTAIYVTNRTHDRAVVLAEKIGGRAVDFRDLYHYIKLSDVVISCTAAPHPVIHADRLIESMKGRLWPLDEHPRPLILIDIAQPRDVEEGIEKIDGVHLFTIDSLRTVSEQNLNNRRDEAARAEEYIEEELDHFIRLLKRAAADESIGALYTWAEMIRLRERDRALTRLAASSEKPDVVIDDLTKVIVKKLLSDMTMSIRSCAEEGDINAAESLVKAITQGERICIHKDE